MRRVKWRRREGLEFELELSAGEDGDGLWWEVWRFSRVLGFG